MTTYLDAYATVICVAICLCLNTLYTEGSLQDQHIGCYQNITSLSTWTNGIIDSNTLSIELCIETCRQKSTTYAMLQNGRKCLCGDVVDASSPDNACNTRCSGNQRQICGGSSEAVSSYVIYSVCPIGFYGVGCNQTCHCKQQIPCFRISGICPNGCEDSWTLANCSKETSQSVSDRRVGCYRDAEERALGEFFKRLPSTCTIELCSSICVSNNYTYSGTEVGQECYCGENYNKYGPIEDSTCGTRCDGDATEFCGRGWALSVYSACPIGYFGSGCMSRSNCKNQGKCASPGCTCSSGCKSGWLGTRCEFRNCSDNNGDCSVNETCVTVDLKFSSVTRCNCKQGYQRNRLWDTCTDRDECYLETHNLCDDVTTTCNNTIGSYFCDCRPGYYRINATLCHGIPSNTSTGLQGSLSGNCEKVYSVDVVIGAAIGSAVGSTVIFAIILTAVVLCRRRQLQQHKQSEDANQIQLQHKTDASYEKPIPQLNYETLDRNLNPDESTYTDLDGCRK